MIFTFYSYKGGVGRSMALATVSRMLAARGLRVLAVDFDLEAPGLEHYYYDKGSLLEPRKQRGLMDLIRAYRAALTDEQARKEAEFKDLSRFTRPCREHVGDRGGSVHLMTAGRREPPEAEREYALEVRRFDWQDFYFNWKGDRFFDWLRRQWSADTDGYDVVLVDSRTGITEMGGVCAYQLADAAVLLCAPNYQNLRGTKAIAADFRSDSVTALRYGRPLEILAVPARLEPEHPRRDAFLAEFEHELGPDGLPRKLAELGITYRDLVLPYLPEFAIEELQVDDYLDDKALLKPSFRGYERLADALTLLAPNSDPLFPFANDALMRIRGGEVFKLTPLVANTARTSAGYDVFLDVGTGDRAAGDALIRRLALEGLTAFLPVDLDRVDAGALAAGSAWRDELERALDYSAMLLVCFGASGSSPFRDELLKRARQRTRHHILPLLLPGGDKNDLRSFGLDELQFIDAREGLNDEAIAEIAAILKQPPSSVESGDAEIVANPYVGARAYGEDEASRFFGREQEIDAIVGALRAYHVVLVEGPAKVGKTSLVTAGVMARLRPQTADAVNRLLYVDATADRIQLPAWVTPAPPQSTGDDRARPDVIIVDGLDSSLGPSDWRERRLPLLNSLLAATGPGCRLLLVWRGVLPDSDYQLALEEWRDGEFAFVRIEPLQGDALRRAIEQPARTAGHLLENGLTERIVEGAGSARSAIVQMQLALERLWRDRRRGWLTNRGLDAVGHVAGLFHEHLTHTLADASFSQSAAEALVAALAEVNSSGELVARAMPWAQLSTIPRLGRAEGTSVRDLLVDNGLLDWWRPRLDEPRTGEGGTVRVALVRPEISKYFEAIGAAPDPDFLSWRSALGGPLASWQASNRSADTLLTDQALRDAERWMTRYGGFLLENERACIDASVAARTARAKPLQITVMHGDLCFVFAPVLLGHYESFRLTGTEAFANAQLGGAMQQALAAGVYPSAPGTHQIFANQRIDPLNPWQGPRPPAFIVAGLGREGEPSPPDIRTSVRQAVLGWAGRERESAPSTSAFVLAATLVGSGGSGIDVSQAAEAVVEGVQEANARLTDDRWPEVSRLIIVERYLDRATEAWRTLQTRALSASAKLSIDDTVLTGIGGLSRPISTNYRGAAYDLLRVRSERSDEGQSFVYTLATRRTRNDVQARQRVPSLLNDLVKSASEAVEQSNDFGRTLCQLLVPSAIQPVFRGDAETVLEVDHDSAWIPWEALQSGDIDLSHERPWAIRSKLIRAWRSDGARGHVLEANAESSALIIGDPASDPELFPPLDGARAEARAVAQSLASLGEGHVMSLVSDDTKPLDSRTVLSRLFDRPWRIIHIAGHGRRSDFFPGIALSDDSVLGAHELNALRAVPELVFVNPAHLPRPDRSASITSAAYERSLFAARLAEGLLGIGVRCVIVAGLAVDSEAAAHFATMFYQRLLAGHRFMDAVAAARAAVYSPSDQTWAAFHCYGDPDWVLDRAAALPLPPVAEYDTSPSVASPADLILILEAMEVDARLDRRSREELRRTLEFLQGRYAAQGFRGQVAERLGFAWAATGELQIAIDWLSRARYAADGEVSSRALEQLGSLHLRLARARLPTGGPDAARSSVHEALQTFAALAAGRSTMELHSLWGSAYKTLVSIEVAAGNVTAEAEALEQMRAQYLRAEEIGRQTASVHAWVPAMNRMAAELAHNAGRKTWRGLDLAGVERTRQDIETLVSVEPDFWSVVAKSELTLYEMLSRGRLSVHRDTISDQFQSIHLRVSSSAYWASVYESVRFVLDRYGKRATARERTAARSLLDMLRGFAAPEDAPPTVRRGARARPTRTSAGGR